MTTYISHSAEETKAIGRRVGQQLPVNSVVCFFGDLAAGKTTFIKGLAEGAGDFAQTVNSPTFVYLNIYEGQKTVYHFDLYRLRDADEFLSMGFDEMFYARGICCVEWSERIPSLIPADSIHIVMAHAAENCRHITISPNVYGIS
jgi:tRNA threonylcarbamoyladenosine biosynthesis protein TsaE